MITNSQLIIKQQPLKVKKINKKSMLCKLQSSKHSNMKYITQNKEGKRSSKNIEISFPQNNQKNKSLLPLVNIGNKEGSSFQPMQDTQKKWKRQRWLALMPNKGGVLVGLL